MPTGVQDRGRRWTQLNASQHRIEIDAPLVPLPLEVPVGTFRLLDARVPEHKALGRKIHAGHAEAALGATSAWTLRA